MQSEKNFFFYWKGIWYESRYILGFTSQSVYYAPVVNGLMSPIITFIDEACHYVNYAKDTVQVDIYTHVPLLPG